MVYVDQRALFILYHPDYTVGYGISPYHARLACGLYRRWGITPRLEDQYSYICIIRTLSSIHVNLRFIFTVPIIMHNY